MDLSKLLLVSTGQKYGDFLYCSASKYNALFKIDIKETKAEYIGSFPNEKDDELLHRDSCIFQNIICFVPQNGKGVSFFDVLKNEFYYISLEEYGKYISCIYQYENNIYLFPALGNNSIIVIDILTKEKTLYSGYSFLENIQINHVIGDKDILWLPIKGSNCIIELNINNMQWKKHEISKVDYIETISKGNDRIWIISNREDLVYSWNYKDNKINKYLINTNKQGLLVPYSDVIETQSGTYIIPCEKKDIYKLDLEGDTFSSCCTFPYAFKTIEEEISTFFISRTWYDDRRVILPYNSNYLIIIDGTKEKISFIKIDKEETPKLEDIIKKRYLEKYSNGLLIEKEYFGLSEYIDFINYQE